MITASVFYAEIPKEEPVIDPQQLREMITEVLATAPRPRLNSMAAVELLMLTAATESKAGTYFRQIRGPALGVFQMEPNTETDIFDNYLRYNDDLREWIDGLKTSWHDHDLQYNLAYQIAMARIHYLRSPMRMPPADDAPALARKWKSVYNTHLGKGTVEKALQDYELYAGGVDLAMARHGAADTIGAYLEAKGRK